jgi:hypothetical protein
VKDLKVLDHEIDKYLRLLYDSEINVGIESYWDGGWTARLGDETNGYISVEYHLETLGSAVTWLCQEAYKRFPDSVFAKWCDK